MAKKEEKVAGPTSKARLRVHSQTLATILRNDGLPAITDRTEEAVKWLAAQGFKPAEIEILGDKPATWDMVFPLAEVAA